MKPFYCANVEWTKILLRKFNVAYELAVSRNATEFEFDRNKYTTKKAKELIEYLDDAINDQTYQKRRKG